MFCVLGRILTVIDALFHVSATLLSPCDIAEDFREVMPINLFNTDSYLTIKIIKAELPSFLPETSPSHSGQRFLVLHYGILMVSCRVCRSRCQAHLPPFGPRSLPFCSAAPPQSLPVVKGNCHWRCSTSYFSLINGIIFRLLA